MAAGRYIVEAGEPGQAVYRLSHQRLAQHLRTRTRNRGIEDAPLRYQAPTHRPLQTIMNC